MKYKISKYLFFISNVIILNKHWNLFKEEKIKSNFIFVMDYADMHNIFNDVSICSIANNSILLKKESDLVLVNNEWNSI